MNQPHRSLNCSRLPALARDLARAGQPLCVGEWNVIHDAAASGPMTRKHIEALGARGWSWALWI
jgi:hypothetical protein